IPSLMDRILFGRHGRRVRHVARCSTTCRPVTRPNPPAADAKRSSRRSYASAPLPILNHVPTSPDIFGKQYILTAGPTPLPPSVSAVMADPILYHRAPAFVEIYSRVLERLPQVFQTGNDVLCFAATGTGAMESAVANLVGPGEPAMVASCGKFGDRWGEL